MRGLLSPKLPDRTVVLKRTNQLRELIADKMELQAAIYWWDMVYQDGEEMADAVWSSLTTEQREYLFQWQSDYSPDVPARGEQDG